MFTAILIAGLAAIAASLLGCATLRIRSRVIPVTFAILLTPIFAIYVVTTIKIQVILKNTENGVTDYCNTRQWADGQMSKLLQQYITDTDNQIMPIASKWMCSK